MSRASADLMDLLHGLVASSLREELERAAEAAAQPQTILVEGKEAPNPAYAPMNPQLIDKALKFLKDNCITAPASNKPASDLAGVLQDLDLDEEAARLRH
jgi:hypothetical protein